MGSKAKKSAYGVYGLGALADGFSKGLDTNRQLNQLAAERAIKQEALAIERENAKIKNNQGNTDAQLRLLALGQGSTLFGADGSRTDVEGAKGYSIGADGSMIAGPGASPGARRVIPPPKPMMGTINIPTSEFLQNPGAYKSPPEGYKYNFVDQPSQGRGTAMQANKLDTEFTKAYNFLYKVRQNRDTLQGDVARGEGGEDRKLLLSKWRPTAGQGMVGTLARGMGAGSPEQAAFASEVGKVIDVYRHDITGAAAGFPELTKLEGRLPTTEEHEDNFFSKTKDTLHTGVAILNDHLQRAKARGIDTSAYEQQLQELYPEYFQAGVPPPSGASSLPVPGPAGSYVGGPQVPSFSTPEAAEAAGLPKGTIVSIGGRRAVIE